MDAPDKPTHSFHPADDAADEPPGVPAPPARPPLDEEPGTHVPGSFLEALPQFFVFPLILVATLAAAWLGLRMLVGGGAGDPRELIADVHRAAGPHGQWQAAHTLADGLRRGRVTLDDVPTSEVAALYDAFATSDPQMRQFLLEVLGWKRDPELTGRVVDALGAEDEQVRMAALMALASLQDPASVPPLVDVMRGGARDERWLALGALARVGGPDALDAIAGRLGGEDSLLHRNAVLALAQAGDARAAPWLPALLHRDGYADDSRLDGPDAALQDESSRAAARESVVEQFLVSACRAAAHMADPSVAPLLRALRANDPSVKVRSAAINALHDLGVSQESS
jgi:HEAT repeat protein